MTFVYAVPPVLPPAPPEKWRGLVVKWTGWDGTEWDLTDYRSGVFLQNSGVEGLTMPAHTAWTAGSPAVHGQYYRGHVVEPRTVFWPVHIYGDTSEEWLSRNAAFWRTMHPGKYGTWSVTTPGGSQRTLSCRFVDDGGHSYGLDPSMAGWASYAVSLIADQPFWLGEPQRRTWAQSDPVDFFGGLAKGPPFRISSGSQLATATITNEGDVEAWPVWTIRGPATSVTVGVDGRTVQWSITLAEGDTLVIDTDPTVQCAWLNGVDVTAQLGTASFAPIPAGEDRPLSLTMAGTGSVQAEITPRYYMAMAGR